MQKGLYENGYGVKIIKSVDEAVEFWYEAFKDIPQKKQLNLQKKGF